MPKFKEHNEKSLTKFDAMDVEFAFLIPMRTGLYLKDGALLTE